MPHSRSTSKSPVRIKKQHRHDHIEGKERHKRRREQDVHDHRSDQSSQNRRRQHDRYAGDQGRRVKDEPDDYIHRRIKQEPTDEIVDRRERARHDDKRRENHRQRARDGVDDFTRVGSNAEENSENPDDADTKEKEKPNFEVSGKLADETNTFRGIVVKYNEPPEARKPKRRWRLFPFKGDDALPTLQIHRQSAYLLGRDRIVADIPTDHPSCSKQHAALQFRLVPFGREDGTDGRCVRPYVIDLDSANGTYVNNERVEARCYVELREKDVIKFGFSSREYVLLHDKSDTTELQDGEDEGEADE